jgi:hypothetical protein
MNVIIDHNLQVVNDINEIYSHAAPHELRGLIEKHFIPTNEEKKNNAEIPTPVSLVDEMLNKIPEEFWTTPQKVFEPCCGKGNFVLGIFDKFYEGLKEKYEDEIERCEVIITKCLYYADLTTMNVFITTEILKCHIQSYIGLDELDYKFNSYTGDTLKMEMSGFDAVIGNPPYNDASGNKGKGHTLWTLFVEYSLTKWLNINGYLLFVTPSLWRQANHPLQKVMKEKQIIYLEIHDEKKGLKTFGCNTRYDIYLIQNKMYLENTKIKTQQNELISIDLRLWEFIPNYNYEFLQLITNSNEKLEILHSEGSYEVRKKWMSHEKNEMEYRFPCVYGVNRNNEASFKWSNRNDKGMFGISKVIFGSGATGFIIDKDGEYGLTQWATGIVDDIENLENIANALNSKTFKDVILSTSVSKAEINRKILRYFKKDFWKEFI